MNYEISLMGYDQPFLYNERIEYSIMENIVHKLVNLTLLKFVFQLNTYIIYIYDIYMFSCIITETKMLHTFMCVYQLMTRAIDQR